MKNIQLVKLELVREKQVRYDFKAITGTGSAFKILTDVLHLDKQAEEVIQLLCLDTKNNIVGVFEVARGSLDSSILSTREVFKRAILTNSASIIIAHNHPSGDVEPSEADIRVTKDLKEAGKILRIQLLDHIIVGDGTYYSFLERRMM